MHLFVVVVCNHKITQRNEQQTQCYITAESVDSKIDKYFCLYLSYYIITSSKITAVRRFSLPLEELYVLQMHLHVNKTKWSLLGTR